MNSKLPDVQRSVTSLSLLERLKEDEVPAWDRFVDIYSPLVYRLCRVSDVPADEAADVLQEVFCAVNRNVDKFHRDRPGDSFRGWLCTIVRNKIRDHFRRQAKRPKAIGGTDMMRRIDRIADLDLSSSNDGAVFDSDSSIIHQVIQSVRGEFEERTWEAFWKTTVEGISPVDVAEVLGVSKWAVYQAKSRVLRRLRRELAGLL